MSGETGFPEVLAELGRLQGRITTIENKADSAHKRVDRLESDISSALSEIKADLKPVTAYMNKSKGGLALILVGLPLMGGLISFGIGKILSS